jgi:hypothetical protein
MSDHSSKINPDRFADSAGVSWSGRQFEANSWSGDDGSADPALIAAVNALRTGSGTAEQVLDALRSARVLIPLLADLGELGVGAHGQSVDKSADLSIVTVETPDHQDGLPVFSSVAAMKAWNPNARPVPVFAPKAALAAAQEGNTRVILDPMSATEFVVRRPAIAALAQGLSWIHPVRDERVKEAFAEATSVAKEILSFELHDIDPQAILDAAELQLELKLVAGLSPEELDPILQALTKALADSNDIAEYVESLRVKLANA